MPIRHIALIGAGNVGYHLGQRLAAVGLAPVQVFSRTSAHALDLARLTGAEPVTQLADLTPQADLYLLAVPDDHIAAVAQALHGHLPAHALVAHTSGATPSTVLATFFARHGVFYPLQTFSRAREVDFSQVPLCLHAAHTPDLAELTQLAHRLSQTVCPVDDAQRATLHVAAVFVNNFVNHLYHIGHDIAGEAQLPFALLQPLILETAAKVQQLTPAQAQTGPASRGDQLTIARHLAYLQHQHPHWQKIYQLLTAAITHREP